MKRYFVDGIDCHWQEHPEGWWVGYEDFAEAIERAFRDGLAYATTVEIKDAAGADLAWQQSQVRAALQPDTGETP